MTGPGVRSWSLDSHLILSRYLKRKREKTKERERERERSQWDRIQPPWSRARTVYIMLYLSRLCFLAFFFLPVLSERFRFFFSVAVVVVSGTDGGGAGLGVRTSS